jgi:hypothetical protein
MSLRLQGRDSGPVGSAKGRISYRAVERRVP